MPLPFFDWTTDHSQGLNDSHTSISYHCAPYESRVSILYKKGEN